jgi:uncharacterized protein YjbI with pentapeptide repeats
MHYQRLNLLLLSMFLTIQTVYAAEILDGLSPASKETPKAAVDATQNDEAQLTHVDFSGQNLSFSNFQLKPLTGANFRQTVLFEARFMGANLTEADFTGAHLVGADFRNSNMQMANLSRADLTRSRVEGAKMQGASYDQFTLFPDGFSPQQYGLIYKQN